MDKIPVRHIKEFINETALPVAFNIRDIRDLFYGRTMVQELHRHSFYYILILEKGKGEHHIDFVSYPVCDYSIYFMRPGQVHKLMLLHESTGYLMEFGNDFYFPHWESASQLFRKVSSNTYSQLDAEAFKKLFSILNYIFLECSNKHDRYTDVIKSSLNILFIELFRQCKNHETIAATGNAYAIGRLEELKNLIEMHILSCKQVSEYAGMMNLSVYQLNAITRSTLTKTCSQVINEYIILEARRYLLATTNQVSQISWHLGYEDVSYFIRFFKKQTGYSPESFRQIFR